MIDNLSILLSHGLLLWCFWILIRSDTLDKEPPPLPDAEPEGFAHGRIDPKQRKKAAGPAQSAESADA